MNKLILIAGDLAAGKTTVAREISLKYKITCLIKDKAKEIISDAITFSNREENRRISKASVRMLINMFEETTISNSDLILEGNFRSDELDDIFEIAKKNNYVVYSFFLCGDKKILYKRFLERIPGRHPTHLTQHLDESFDKYEKVIDEFRELSKNYNFTYIDSSVKSSDEVVKEIEKAVF